MKNQSLLLRLIISMLPGFIILLVVAPSYADDIPVVECQVESLLGSLRNIKAAFKELSLPVPTEFFNAEKSTDEDTFQRCLDQHVALLVHINPESRVKVNRGPAHVFFQRGWHSPAIIKVINDSGVTAHLNVKSITNSTARIRWFTPTPPEQTDRSQICKLTGEKVEYRVLLFLSMATDKQEVTVSMEAGQGTQDLGFRAEVPILLNINKENRHPWWIDNRHDLLWKPVSEGKIKPVKALADWEQRLRHVKLSFEQVSGQIKQKNPLQSSHRPFSDLVRVESVEVLEAITRKKINYLTKDGDWIPAYLLIPNRKQQKLPAVLCLHQTTPKGKAEPVGLGGSRHLHYAHELAERGYVTISPDYPGFGDSVQANPYQMGYASATAKGIVNHQAAIDVLESMPEVNSQSIGCIGHSLGGHNTLFVSLFDSRIKVIATSCGFCSFAKYYNGNLKGWSHRGYMPRIASLYECSPQLMPFDFTEILGAMAPRPVFINAPLRDANFHVDGVRDCIKAALPVYQLYQKPESLIAEFPDCEHDFPLAVRQRCYQFFDKHLAGTVTK